jgi:hypothetical protein
MKTQKKYKKVKLYLLFLENLEACKEDRCYDFFHLLS